MLTSGWMCCVQEVMQTTVISYTLDEMEGVFAEGICDLFGL